VDRHRRAADSALDLLVYAPLGLALAARDAVPGLVARGRAEVANQARAANMVGRMAAQQGCREAERLVRMWLPGVAGSSAGRPRPPTPSAAPSPPVASEADAGPASPARPASGTSSGSAPASQEPPAEAALDRTARSQALAIPGYDTLSASQVVARLDGLTDHQLEAVATYEAAGRSRRTVLTRIAQLRSSTT